MELQSLANGWESLDGLYGVCWKRFGTKRTSGLWDGGETAEAALFCKFLVEVKLQKLPYFLQVDLAFKKSVKWQCKGLYHLA